MYTNKIKRIANKRGNIFDPITLFFTVLILIPIIIIFYFIYVRVGAGVDNEIIGASFERNIDTNLRGYLRSNINISGESQLVSDIIYEIAITGDIKKRDLLQNQSRILLQGLGDWGWNIYVADASYSQTRGNLFYTPLFTMDSAKGLPEGGNPSFVGNAEVQLPPRDVNEDGEAEERAQKSIFVRISVWE